jgi:YidC/Oxa1 family membrane protein insertase
MGITMFIQQKLAPASPDPAQAKMMMMLPVVFTFLFAHFPAGLVLYWIVNNTLSILQQWYITQKYSGEKKKVKPANKPGRTLPGVFSVLSKKK